ncbi:hypothetical protein V6N11_076061 [Hibiscus sabdariffa]|uniref:Uncharacterized protein n=1 Tax=Hibiscus sabdariffa TaxID=183260 RepID=A0ABR2Q549_9ROSI
MVPLATLTDASLWSSELKDLDLFSGTPSIVKIESSKLMMDRLFRFSLGRYKPGPCCCNPSGSHCLHGEEDLLQTPRIRAWK